MRSEVGPAEFSPDRLHRYTLTRTWDGGVGTAAWIGLNPSTADESQLDPTLRRVRNFSRAWGYRSFVMLNLFAYRATRPVDMLKVEDPVGPMNDVFIENVCSGAGIIVCAWGAHGGHLHRDREVWAILQRLPYRSYCLGVTKDGHPRHPLYVTSATAPDLYGGPR